MRGPDVPESHPWHPSKVTTEKMEQLYNRIQQILEELFERDEDGDFPVEVRLVNRTIHETMAGILPVPYAHRAETKDDFDEIVAPLLSNLSRTTRRLEQVVQWRKEAKRPERITDVKVVPLPEPKIPETIQPPRVPQPPSDLQVGEFVIILPSKDTPTYRGEVVALIQAGIQLTEGQVTQWVSAARNASPRQLARMRKAVDYDRFIIERHDGQYMIVPRIPDQLKQLLLK